MSKSPDENERATAGVACQFSQSTLLGMMSPRPAVPSIEDLMKESSQAIGTAPADFSSVGPSSERNFVLDEAVPIAKCIHIRLSKGGGFLPQARRHCASESARRKETSLACTVWMREQSGE
jgi:hypothetical protein